MATFYSRAKARILEHPYHIPSGVFFTHDESHQESLEASFSTVFPVFTSARPAVRSVELARHVQPSPAAPNLQASPNGPANTPRATQVFCLPLLRVSTNARVEDTIVTTGLTQQFTNLSELPIPEAHYTFPLYDGAAITSFNCYIGDSDVLVGRFHATEEAKRKYTAAIEKMETAALLEEKTPEVFQTVIGNITSRTVVRVQIIYIQSGSCWKRSSTYSSYIRGSALWTSTRRLASSSDMVHEGLAIKVAVVALQPIRQMECGHIQFQSNLDLPERLLTFKTVTHFSRK